MALMFGVSSAALVMGWSSRYSVDETSQIVMGSFANIGDIRVFA